MLTTVRKIGNLTGAIFSSSILKEYGIKAGTPVGNSYFRIYDRR